MPHLSVIRAREQQGVPPEGLMKAMDVYVARTLKDGTVVSTGGLAPGSAAVRVRIEGGRIKVIDGPFTESKEVVGGYAILQAKDKAEVLVWTKRFLQVHEDHWNVTSEIREIAEG